MPKRYQGNSGRYSWVAPPERPPAPPMRPPERPPAPPVGTPRRPPPVGIPGLPALPRLLGELETEDLILMLLCWLLYRESGDGDWLIALGAMLLG